MTALDRLEQWIENLVEGTLARWRRGRLQPVQLAKRLARAMEDAQVIGPDGHPRAPDRYQVLVHPADYEELRESRQALEKDLTEYVLQLAQRTGRLLLARPEVHIQPGNEVPPGRVQVVAHLSAGEADLPAGPGSTQMIPVTAAPVTPSLHPVRYVLADGARRIPLDRPIIALGRSLDNDVILDHPSVSRHHAQLRWRDDRYVLYDLDSTGGTTVNGQPVRECPLQPGDVIALGGVSLRFLAADDAS